jgi:hypothetical protein
MALAVFDLSSNWFSMKIWIQLKVYLSGLILFDKLEKKTSKFMWLVTRLILTIKYLHKPGRWHNNWQRNRLKTISKSQRKRIQTSKIYSVRLLMNCWPYIARNKLQPVWILTVLVRGKRRKWIKALMVRRLKQ